MSAMLGIVALLAVIVFGGLVLSGAVWLGTVAYVSWRVFQRDTQNRTHFPFGPYRSPFPWHRHEQEQEKKRA